MEERTRLIRSWRRLLVVLVALAAVAALVIGISLTAGAAPRPTAIRPGTLTGPSTTVPGGTTITGLDLHDGTIVQDAGQYILYGTEYGCGFRWGDASTHFCGFGYATAPALAGPWSAVTTLLSPTAVDPWSGRTWDAQCIRTNAAGCFNPRVVHNPTTGKWLLWFNAVGDNTFDHANAYNVYEMSSPTGPLGTFHKPASYTCAGCNGDFSIVPDGANAYLVGTGSNRAEYVEQLDATWTNGTGNVAGHGTSALFDDVEGSGAYRDPDTGKWIMVLAWTECGYCGGSHVIYGTAPTMLGPWSSPGNWEAPGGPSTYNHRARATISGTACGGQERTVVTLDGQAYAFMDLWTGTTSNYDAGRNQAGATVHLEPLTYQNPSGLPGSPLQPFTPWSCS